MAVKNEKTSGGSSGSREAVEDTTPLSKDINGVTLRALTTKNRVVPPFMETEMYLNFKSGLAKYSGLLDMAVGYGVVIQNGATFALADGTKLGYYKSWRQDEDIWKQILPLLEVKLQTELQYKKESISEEPDPIDNEVED
jgi:hypothetical protein